MRTLRRNEFQRHSIDAVSQAGRRRAIVENMPLMAVASSAMDFGSRHEEFLVGFRFDGGLLDRSPKARPPRSTLEFVLRRKQRQLTPPALIHPFFMIIVVGAGKRPLRSFLPQHIVLILSQQLFPFIIRLGHFHDASLLGFYRPQSHMLGEKSYSKRDPAFQECSSIHAGLL